MGEYLEEIIVVNFLIISNVNYIQFGQLYKLQSKLQSREQIERNRHLDFILSDTTYHDLITMLLEKRQNLESLYQGKLETLISQVSYIELIYFTIRAYDKSIRQSHRINIINDKKPRVLPIPCRLSSKKQRRNYSFFDLKQQFFRYLVYIKKNIIFLEENTMRHSLIKNHSTDISEFIEQKNEEIQNLKTKILGSSVTYDEMQLAKSKLDDLRLTQIKLEKEDYSQLKDVLKSCANTITELTHKKSHLNTKLQEENNDLSEMNQLCSELLVKKEKMFKMLADLKDEGNKASNKKQKKNGEILEIQNQIKKIKKELSVERQIQEQLYVAEEQLGSKMKNGELQLKETQEDNLKLREQIKLEMQKINKLQHTIDLTDQKAQFLQERISHEETKSTLFHHKIQYCRQFLQALAENKLILLSEEETSANIQSLITMCKQSYQKKQKEEKECEQTIESVIKNIEKSKQMKIQKESQLKVKKQTLKDLKEKGAELKHILNSVFMEDSNVLKLIADKKVFDEQENSNQLKLTQNSVNQSTGLKHDMMASMETSDNFFMSQTPSTTY